MRKQPLERGAGLYPASDGEHYDTGEPATPAESAIQRARAGHHHHHSRE
ncbi:MAG TPA: hypothetical protein VD841_04575 [Arthrobacter sp.]|nr:hypothetical protein [Arthrobacter sp.]